MIKKIIHIGDLHIPNEPEGRHYDELIKKLVKDVLKEVKTCDDKSEARIVIAGDIYTGKIKSSNEAKGLFHEMLNLLNSICKVIVIAGNHDMLENNKSRMDSITPTFEIKGVYKNVTYLDKALGYKSGFCVDDNVVWVLYSMFDRYNVNGLETIREQYPNHKIIGLYHGNVVGATTDTGYMLDKGINTDLFSECDCVMAGHIHKYQTIKKKGVPIVYSGSVFQQDTGENVSGHGFVVWDLESMNHELHEVENDYSTYKFEITSYDDVSNDAEILLNA